jgi:hypothetical protein
MSTKPTTDCRQPRHVYRCHNTACPARAECTKDKKGRTIKRLDTEEAFVRQVALQSTPEKKILLGLRKVVPGDQDRGFARSERALAANRRRSVVHYPDGLAHSPAGVPAVVHCFPALG